jgi:UDP-N-acetylglucosamine--N-acetylmuramyl-(pentapeptide) pyrophosphoryl-undecaprenol N-acetylglucosamine transferase
MRIVVTGGGTGGHVYPALSILEALMENDSTIEPIYVGTEKGIESRIVKEAGIPFETIDIQGINKKFNFETFSRLIKVFTSIFEANRILKRYRPACVLGTGGYVSFPILFVASFKKIPVFIHEQNAYPGLANKVLCRRARKLFISFPESMEHFKCDSSRMILSGNPVRAEFSHSRREECREHLSIERETKVILAFGGSGGARAINEFTIDLARTLKDRSNVKIILATGVRYYKEIQGMKDLPENLKINAYIDDMPCTMGASDLVIARSGAITLSEISTLGLPAVLIPSPNVANDHQLENAKAFANHDAAVIVREDPESISRAIGTISEMIDAPERLMQMGKNSERVLLHNAAKIIADEILGSI